MITFADEEKKIPGPVETQTLEGVTIHTADCRDAMRLMDENSIDTIITDPPYGLGFMGKEWDTFDPGFNAEETETRKSGIGGRTIRRPANEAGRYNRSRDANFGFQVAMTEFFAEALRVAKPGAMLFAFGGTRTFHRLTCAIEDAGWEIRDTMGWLHGQGFPKSHNIAGAIDRKLGHGARGHAISTASKVRPDGTILPPGERLDAYEARSEEAEPWTGYGTALKPAWEPICVAMKPLDGTFAENALKWGVAGINVDEGRIDAEVETGWGGNPSNGYSGGLDSKENGRPVLGRWPANILHDGSPEALSVFPDEDGSAARFFYCAKASSEERNEGLDAFRNVRASEITGRKEGSPGLEMADGKQNPYAGKASPINRNVHPTVKPLELMRYLVRLAKMPQRPAHRQKVLDLFAGSGTTGVACIWEDVDAVLIEKTPEYAQIIRARCAHAIKQKSMQPELFTPETEPDPEEENQLDLFEVEA